MSSFAVVVGWIAAGVTSPAAATVGAECGVAPAAAPGETSERSITVGAEERRFLLFVPGAFDSSEPTPVVLNLHGAGGHAAEQAEFSGLTDTADSAGFILVHPEASPRTDFNWQFEGRAEAEFVDELLTTLAAELCVDADRVYAVGGSQGGDLSTLLACQLPHRIAAVASVTVLNHHDSCAPPTPTPVLAFVGTADPIYSIEEGLLLPPGVGGVAVEELIPGPLGDEALAWATTNGCEPEPTVDDVTEAITRHEFACPDGHDLVYYVHSGGHVWPGTDPGPDFVAELGPAVLELDANTLIWEFFEAHPAAADRRPATATAEAAAGTVATSVGTRDAVTYASSDFAVPFEVTVPDWVPAEPSIERPNFVTWESSDIDRAIRFLVPVTVIPPGDTTPTAVPDDYVAYLLSQTDFGGGLDDVVETTVDGRPATIVTATTDTFLDGSLGCEGDGPRHALLCWGLIPEGILRMAVVDAGDQTLLVWQRDATDAEQPVDYSSFDEMLATLHFPEDAGTSEEPPTLRVAATPGWEGRVEPLISAVAGGLDIEFDWAWQDAHAASDSEQRIVSAVAAGELDLGFVGTRAFTELGVTSFDALAAPFLVDGYSLQQAVLDSDIPDRMLAGLDDLGVTGLAVAAGPLRRPLGVDGPLVSPEDFAGITFHTWPSVNNAATAELLGATHTDVFGPERDARIDDGSIDATENGLEWVSLNGRTSYATLNAPLWPATAVLIGNPEVLDRLSDSQLAALEGAAADSLATPAELADEDVELIGRLCAVGKRFVEASDDDLAALRQAVQPVHDRLAEDAATAVYLAEIEALKSTASPDAFEIPEDCTGAASAPAAVVVEGTDDPSVLNGAYRIEWTAEELLEALIEAGEDFDLPPPPEAAIERDAQNNAGSFVLIFDDGEFDSYLERDPTDNCPGIYAVSGNRVTMTASTDLAEWHCGAESLGQLYLDAAWELTDGQLILSDFVISDEPGISWWNAVYLGKPLTRVDDPESTIPSGMYTRTMTRADAEALGAAPGFIAAEIGPDDELTIRLELDDGRWIQQANYSGGDVFTYGDDGTYTYDEEGRLVTTSESTGCRGCVGVFEWTFDEGVLTMELVACDQGGPRPCDPIETLMTSGDYDQVE